MSFYPDPKYPVTANVSVNAHGLQRVQGLENVIMDEFDHTRRMWDEYAYRRLLARLENAEVFLVHAPGSEPVAPLLRRSTEKEQSVWQINVGLNHQQHFNVEWMLSYANGKKGIWAPVIAPETQAPVAVTAARPEPAPIAITNPRWEHTDQQRSEDSPDATIAGDKVKLKVDVSGVPDGAPVTVKVFDTSSASAPPSLVAKLRGKVEAGICTVDWDVKPKHTEPKLEFEGEVRRISSERAEIPVKTEKMLSVVPMIFTTTDFNREKAIPLPEGSYLYVFRDGKLYSEHKMEKGKSGKKSNGTPNLKAIDLDALRNKHDGKLPDSRKPKWGFGKDVFQVPCGDEAQSGPEIQVAVSQVQWSARYIEALEQDNDKRSTRTQTLDLTGRDNHFEGSQNLAALDAYEVPQHVKVNGTDVYTGWLSAHKESGYALAYLQDPIYQAVLLAAGAQNAWEELEQVIAQAKTHPHFDSAVIAYPLFFNEEVQDDSRRNESIGKAVELSYKLNPLMIVPNLLGFDEAMGSAATHIFDSFDAQVSAMRAIDRDKIETVLKVQRRKTLRDRIRHRKRAQVDWLEGRYGGTEQTVIPFNTAVIDYFTLHAGCYHQGFELMSLLCTRLADDPSELDASITLAEDRQAETGEENAGYRYMQELFDEAHPLHKMLFPTEEQVPVTSDAPPSGDLIPNDGSGACRPHALDPQGFAEATGVPIEEIEAAEYTVADFQLADVGQTYRRVAEFSASAMTDFAAQFTKHWAKWQNEYMMAASTTRQARASVKAAEAGLDTAQTQAFNANKAAQRMQVLTRGLKASNLGAFSTLRVTDLKHLPADHVVIGLNVLQDAGPLTTGEVRAEAIEGNRKLREGSAGRTKITDGAGVAQAAEFHKDVNIRGSAGRSGNTVWEISKDVHKWDIQVVALPRDVAEALDIDYFDVHHRVELDLSQANATSGPVNPSVQAIHDAQNSLQNRTANLNRQETNLADIGSQKTGAEASRVKGERFGRLAAGASVVAALFNVWNTVGAYEAWEKDNLGKTLNLVSAGMDLAYAMGEAVEALGKKSSLAQEVVHFKLGGVNLFKSFGAGAAAFSAVLAVIAAVDELDQGDPDAAAAQGLMAIGFGLSALHLGAAAIATELSGALVTGLAAGPVGWIGLGIVLIGAALYMVFNDSELERWAKNGPFAKNNTDRDSDLAWLADGAMQGSDGKTDGFPAFEFLLGTLFTPTLTLDLPTKGRRAGYSRSTGLSQAVDAHDEIIVRVGIPPLFPQAAVDIIAELDHSETRFRNPADHSEGHSEPSGYCRALKPLTVEQEKAISVDENGRLTRNYYFTPLPNPLPVPQHGRRVIEDKSLINVEDTYRFQARLQANKTLIFPIIERDATGKRKRSPGEIEGLNQAQVGWIYGLATFTASRYTNSRWLKHDNILPGQE